MFRKILNWIGRPRNEMTDSEREVGRMMTEVRLASDFAWFMSSALNRGYRAKLTIEVDGVPCSTGILLTPKEPLMEYLANWACAQHYRKIGRVMDFKARMAGAVVPEDGDFDKLWNRIQESDIDPRTGWGGVQGVNDWEE